MNKLLITIATLFAYSGLFSQTWNTGTGAWISPLSKNIGIQKSLQVGDNVGTDSLWCKTDLNYFEGNVGIGTTTPQAKLHVSSIDTPSVAIAHFENNLGTAIITVHSHADSSAIYYMQSGAYSAGIGLVGITEKLVITNGLGSVAIEIDTTGITNVLQNLSISNGTTSQGKLYFVEDQDNGSNSITLQSPASLAADYALTFPANDGAANELLQTNGSGVLSWQNPNHVSPWQISDTNNIFWQSSQNTLTILSLTPTSYAFFNANSGFTMFSDSIGFNFNAPVEPTDSNIQSLGTPAKRWGDGLINALTTYSIVDEGSTVNTTAGDAATINAISGRFRKDATGAAFTLSNAYITTSSIIVLTAANAAIDVTALTFTVAAGSGSAVITFNAAPTANFDMNFLIIN